MNGRIICNRLGISKKKASRTNQDFDIFHLKTTCKNCQFLTYTKVMNDYGEVDATRI